MSHEPKPTHRLEFSVFDLMTYKSLGSQFTSVPFKNPDGTSCQRIGGDLIIPVEGEGPPLAFKVAPWFNKNPMMVSIFWRRQDPVEHMKIRGLRDILEFCGVDHKVTTLKR